MYNGRCYVLELRRAEFASFEMEHFKILVKVNHLKAVSALTVGTVFYIHVLPIIGCLGMEHHQPVPFPQLLPRAISCLLKVL